MRKNPVYRDSNSRSNVSEGYEVTYELPRRPAVIRNNQCITVYNFDPILLYAVYSTLDKYFNGHEKVI